MEVELLWWVRRGAIVAGSAGLALAATGLAWTAMAGLHELVQAIHGTPPDERTVLTWTNTAGGKRTALPFAGVLAGTWMTALLLAGPHPGYDLADPVDLMMTTMWSTVFAVLAMLAVQEERALRRERRAADRKEGEG